TLSGRVAEPGRPLDVEVRMAAGGHYVLRVFDLEGNQVRELGRGGAGRNVHSWDGTGERGAVLGPGPYLLCLDGGSGLRRRAAVILGDGR
ncbi:MAG TPA: hypothetical protein VJ385_14900, partial [Fibrobacteria bacterium]|nr:hypothetical protein [Fibrobacteria bacterium]